MTGWEEDPKKQSGIGIPSYQPRCRLISPVSRHISPNPDSYLPYLVITNSVQTHMISPVTRHVTHIPSYQPQSRFISTVSRHISHGSDSYHRYPTILAPVKFHTTHIQPYQPPCLYADRPAKHIDPMSVKCWTSGCDACTTMKGRGKQSVRYSLSKYRPSTWTVL